MKKTIIGAVLFLGGLCTVISLINSAISYLPHLTAWSSDHPSKLWFLIFAGRSPFNDGADGLGLGFVFVIGSIFVVLGLIILGREYFSKRAKG